MKDYTTFLANIYIVDYCKLSQAPKQATAKSSLKENQAKTVFEEMRVGFEKSPSDS